MKKEIKVNLELEVLRRLERMKDTHYDENGNVVYESVDDLNKLLNVLMKDEENSNNFNINEKKNSISEKELNNRKSLDDRKITIDEKKHDLNEYEVDEKIKIEKIKTEIDEKRYELNKLESESKQKIEMENLSLGKEKLTHEIFNDKRKLDIEEIKIQNDMDTNINKLRNELKKIDMEKALGYLKLGIEVTAIVLPVVTYSTLMKKGFQFEESGTITSKTLMNVFGKLKATK